MSSLRKSRRHLGIGVVAGVAAFTCVLVLAGGAGAVGSGSVSLTASAPPVAGSWS